MKREDEPMLLHRIEKKFRKGIQEYDLIQDSDRILIGLSGGKDSIALLELLGRRKRIFKPRFDVVVAHIVMSNIPYESDLDYLQSLVESYELPFVVHETNFDPSTDDRKSPCFLCSWMRRKALFELAKEHQCNKIALGHHQDDIIETMLMNLMHQGTFSTMPPLLSMNKFDMQIIRPMCLISERELIELAHLRGYRKQQKNCPYESGSSRSDVKKLITEMEKINPKARHSLWASMGHVQPDYLPCKKK